MAIIRGDESPSTARSRTPYLPGVMVRASLVVNIILNKIAVKLGLYPVMTYFVTNLHNFPHIVSSLLMKTIKSVFSEF